MRKVLALALSVTMASFNFAVSLHAAAPTKQGGQQTGGVDVVATDQAKQPLPKVNVRLVTPDGKTIVAQGVTNEVGQVSFAGIQPGNYMVQILDATGNVVGTSASISVAAGATVTVGVTAAAAGAIAAAAGGGIGLFGLGTLGTVSVLGAGALVTGLAIKATKDEASPSR